MASRCSERLRLRAKVAAALEGRQGTGLGAWPVDSFVTWEAACISSTYGASKFGLGWRTLVHSAAYGSAASASTALCPVSEGSAASRTVAPSVLTTVGAVLLPLCRPCLGGEYVKCSTAIRSVGLQGCTAQNCFRRINILHRT